MGPLILFVLGLVAGVALTLYLQRRTSDRRDLTAPPPRVLPPRLTTPPPPPPVAPSDIDEAEIIVLLRLGRKIEAIKRLREQTGMGLAEAKDAVETIEREQRG